MSMNNILKAALFTPGRRGWGLPLMIWGEAGTAKTEAVESISKRFGMHCEVLSPGERGEAAFGVLPVPIERTVNPGTKSERKRWAISYPEPEYMAMIDEDYEGMAVMFLDELPTAAPAIQPAMLGLIQARRLGARYLGKHVRPIAAGNAVDQTAGGGYELPSAVANRLVHLDWIAPEVDEWVEWMLSVDLSGPSKDKPESAPGEEARVLNLWPGASASAVALVTGFIRNHRSILHQKPEEGTPNAGRAWPSRRSWENAARALGGAITHGLDPNDTDTLIAGCVGKGPAVEFAKWRVNSDLPDPIAVLDGKVKWSHDAQRLDRTMLVLSSCAAFMCSDAWRTGEKADKKLVDERLGAMWKLIDGVMSETPDIAYITGRALARAKLTNHKLAIPTLAKMKIVTDASGLTSKNIGG